MPFVWYKKFINKNQERLHRFLDIILFTCGTSFHNTCNLTMAFTFELNFNQNRFNTDSEASKSNNVNGCISNEIREFDEYNNDCNNDNE